MEQCTIYSHYLNFDQIEGIIRKHLPNATIEREDEPQQKSIEVSYKKNLLSKKQHLTINCRTRLQPSYTLTQVSCPLTQNLAGMINFVSSLEVDNSNTQALLVQKIMTINSEMPFIAKPYITEEFENILKEIVQEQDAFLFTPSSSLFSKSKEQHFLNKHFDLILDISGVTGVNELDVNIESKYFDKTPENYTQAQLDRKARSEAYLDEETITINQNLPCVADEEAVSLRSLSDVIERIYALTLVTAKAEGVEEEHLLRMMKEKEIHHFSPYEQYLLDSTLTEEEKRLATWRYESLFVMLWAVKKVDELVYPINVCDVPKLLSLILKPSRADFEKTCELRSKGEILDALDLIYRMNWACVDARIKDEDAPGNIHPGIVFERHYSLNWLSQYRQQDWDDVSTDT